MGKAAEISGFVASKIYLIQSRMDSPWSKSMLAKLRRGVGKNPAEAPEIWEITLNGLPEELLYKGQPEKGSATEAEWAIHTALTLYALHQQGNSYGVSAGRSDGGLSFGSAMRRLILPDRTNEESIKRRFNAIITSNDLSELSNHGRGAIQLMKSSPKPIKLDYPLFAGDLYGYQLKKNSVRLRWGRDFYSMDKGEKEEQKESGE